ncbi:MAG TPA: PEP/pyruvate-binding domain-containing protein [Streptosporangiaceae bacterium]|nr:PEP/pyruvate-binding domain-containing protein [Streptosporangiaceae bacterium]
MGDGQLPRESSSGIYWLGEPPSTDPALVGEEFACLSRLADLRCVQPGFCLTAPPYHVDEDGMLRPGAAELARAYTRLAATAGEADLPVVVRSELAGAAPAASCSAGAPWTFFNVAGTEALIAAMIECLAPYASARARAYRSVDQGSASDIRVAVHVQRFVRCDVCVRVRTGRPDGPGTVRVQARWGACEESARTRGRDVMLLRRSDLAITRTEIGRKDRMWVPEAGGVTEVDVPAAHRTAACLSEPRAQEAARLSLDIESALGAPVEAEVWLAGGRLVLAWCRRTRR